MTDKNETRLQYLEIKSAHQDEQIQDLSDIVNRQWQEIDILKRALNKTNQRIHDLEHPDDGAAPAAEKPPHY